MYCSKCRRRVYYRNLENKGWCEQCRCVIDIAPCAVSHWCVAAVMLMPWLAPLGL